MAVSLPKMPTPAEDALRIIANKIGHSLPPSYIEFVTIHDGAKPEDNTLKIEANEVSVSRFIPVTEAPELAAAIEGFPNDTILVAEDDCGNFFYVEPRSGEVYFWDHELEGPDEKIADDLWDLVAKLTPFDSTQIANVPHRVTRIWVDPAFKPEF